MSEDGQRPDTRAEASEALTSDEEAVLDALGDGPHWPLLPETVTVHPDVDLGAVDPADDDQDRDWRRCVATRRDGHRCSGRASDDSLGCPFHNGRSDPRLAALASHEARKAARDEGATRVALARLGTRGVVLDALTREATSVHAAVRHLAVSAGNGDRQAALALLPYIDQALGKPTERVEHTQPSTLQDLQGMSQEQLEALVAEGRRKRLEAVPAEPDSAASG